MFVVRSFVGAPPDLVAPLRVSRCCSFVVGARHCASLADRDRADRGLVERDLYPDRGLQDVTINLPRVELFWLGLAVSDNFCASIG